VVVNRGVEIERKWKENGQWKMPAMLRKLGCPACIFISCPEIIKWKREELIKGD
jgi:hypothetical protein